MNYSQGRRRFPSKNHESISLSKSALSSHFSILGDAAELSHPPRGSPCRTAVLRVVQSFTRTTSTAVKRETRKPCPIPARHRWLTVEIRGVWKSGRPHRPMAIRWRGQSTLPSPPIGTPPSREQQMKTVALRYPRPPARSQQTPTLGNVRVALFGM